MAESFTIRSMAVCRLEDLWSDHGLGLLLQEVVDLRGWAAEGLTFDWVVWVVTDDGRQGFSLLTDQLVERGPSERFVFETAADDADHAHIEVDGVVLDLAHAEEPHR